MHSVHRDLLVKRRTFEIKPAGQILSQYILIGACLFLTNRVFYRPLTDFSDGKRRIEPVYIPILPICVRWNEFFSIADGFCKHLSPDFRFIPHHIVFDFLTAGLIHDDMIQNLVARFLPHRLDSAD